MDEGVDRLAGDGPEPALLAPPEPAGDLLGRAESGARRNIPGRYGNALAVNGNRDGTMAGGTHLTLGERERVAVLKAEGLSLRAIARALGRAASTVSRELRRNALPKGGYLPVHAEGCYLARRQRQAVLERDAKLGRFVRERLLEGWTPEQIAGWLGRGEERGLRPVSTETIYAFVHRAGRKAEKLWKLLPRGRARRGRRRARPARNAIAERRSIHDRPAEVEKRQEAGHWEGDLLICRRTRPVLVLKERKTRFVLAARLAGKSAAETVAIMMAVFRRLDPRLRASVTFDNDTAFARHGLLASACAMATWFCDAYASWQKGAVENANGRLRRDLPRDLDLDALGDAELQEIILSHNLTPRKCLGFLTPLQALLKELGKDVQIRFA
jgi:IS30 family transposase